MVVLALGRSADFVGDESFYVHYAGQLLDLLAGRGGAPDLGTGPGYPALLLPLAALKPAWLWWRLPNALLLFGAVLYVHATLRLYLSRRAAFGFAFLFGVYPNLLKESFLILSEPLAMWLMCAFVFHFCRAQRDPRRWAHTLAAGVFAAWLVLTKVFFAYVFLVIGAVGAVLYAARRSRVALVTLVVSALALGLCVPYLSYTHARTGRTFFWAYTGGEALYWMSTPYWGEWGAWQSQDLREDERLIAHHGAFLDSLPDSRLEREPALRAKALENIRAHPGKYALNWLANVGRLLFAYPFGYRRQTPLTFLLMVPNMLLVVPAILCVYPTVRGRRALPPELGVLLAFAAVAFGGTSLLAAYERQFRILVPILGTWVAFTLTRIVRIEIRPDAETPPP